MLNTKLCKKCNEIKSLSKFGPDKRRPLGLTLYCRECETAKVKIWRTKNRDKDRHTTFIRSYGISLKEYNAMFDKQNGMCKICRKPQNRELVVDHDHISLKVRGLLCFKCNTGLGNMDDDVIILKSAVKYLMNSKK